MDSYQREPRTRRLRVVGIGTEGFDNLVHSRLKCGDGERLLEIRRRVRSLSHSLVVLDTTPLSVHNNFRSIEAPMKRRRNETLGITYRDLSRAYERIDKLLLVRRFHGKHVDKGDEASIFRDGGHSAISPSQTGAQATVRL